MVYTSDYYTTRSYSRPTVSSYTVSYPVTSYSTGKSRVYTASNYYPYTTYSRYVLPYISSRIITPRFRVIRSPSPVISTRYYRSPSPVISTTTTTRVIRSSSPITSVLPYSYSSLVSSPLRYSYSTPYSYISYPSLYRPYIANPYLDRDFYSPYRINLRTSPSVLAREYDRIFNKLRPSYGYRPLEEYFNSEAFINFDSETRRIRNDAHSLLREIHSSVPRRTRSVTPYYTADDAPISEYALKSYVSRITDPTRHLYRQLRSLSLIPESPRKYMGASSFDLDPNRPTRKFSSPKSIEDPDLDLKEKQRERQERLSAITEETDKLKDKM